MFLNDKGLRVAVLVFQFVQEHHFGAVFVYRQAALQQLVHHVLQIIVVRRFACHIAALQQQAQFFVHGFSVLQRNIHKFAPPSQHSLIAALQFHHIFARGVGEIFVFIKTHFSVAVKLLQICQTEIGIVLLLLGKVGNQHAKLRAPVAHMVLAYHFVPQKAEHARQAVANDAGTQMPNVHFFGKVGR